MDFNTYDINTWKHLMLDDMTVGIILNVEYVRTGSEFTAKEYGEEITKFNSYQDRQGGPEKGYNYVKDYSTEPTWYKHQDIRFNVMTIGGSNSWHIKTVTPISKEQFERLDYSKRYQANSVIKHNDIAKYCGQLYWKINNNWYCDLVNMPFMSKEDVQTYIKDWYETTQK